MSGTQSVEVAVLWDRVKKCKIIEVTMGGIVITSPFAQWAEFTILFIRALAYPDDWLSAEWHALGSPPNDEGIVFAVRRDPAMWCKVVRMGVPERPVMLNYVLTTQLVGLLASALAFPDDQLAGRQVVGQLLMERGDPVAGGAGVVRETVTLPVGRVLPPAG